MTNKTIESASEGTKNVNIKCKWGELLSIDIINIKK